MPSPDDRLDELLARSAPRAPADLADRVLQQAARPRRTAVPLVALAVVGAAAALWLLARPRAPAPGEWRVEGSTGALAGVAPGEGLAPGARPSTGAASSALLGDGAGHGLALAAETIVHVAAPPRLEGGALRLQGDGAAVEVISARVTAIGRGADIDIRIHGRDTMGSSSKKAVGVTAAAGVFVTVYALHGQARIETTEPVASRVIAEGEKAVVAPGRAPLLARAPGKTAAASAPLAGVQAPPAQAALAVRGPVAPPATAEAQAAPRGAAAAGAEDEREAELMNEAFVTLVPELKGCYDQALEKDPGVRGAITVSLTIARREGKGRVDEATILPGGDAGTGDLGSPVLEHCILGKLAEGEFPVPKEGTSVVLKIPLNFLAH